MTTKAQRAGRRVEGPLADLQRGTKVTVRDAFDREHDRIALTGSVWGYDFPVVWIVRPEVYAADPTTTSDEEAVPWPVEDVWPR